MPPQGSRRSDLRRIGVDYITRIEGQAALDLWLSRDGELRDVKLRIFEPPRFFEAILRGRRYDEVAEIASRICGVCPITHQVTALKAVERALGIEVTPEVRLLRRLLAMGGIISSHAASIYLLTLPDYLNRPTLLGEPELLRRAVALIRAGDEVASLIGGRAIHPVTAVVGGFTHTPSRAEAEQVRRRLLEAREDALKTVELFEEVEVPRFERRCEHVALRGKEGYAINDGLIASTEGLRITAEEYREHVVEFQVPHSTAKHSEMRGRSTFLVGPLARVNLNYDRLSADAREAAEELGFRPPCFNPFAAPLARVVEVLHLIDECLEVPTGGCEPPPLEPGEGSGAAVTEAPRGLNYHRYELDGEGTVSGCDISPPTCQNARNIEMDLWKLVPGLLDLSEGELLRRCEMLIRAYDPCVSCSVHMVRLHWV
ncbi:MAG: Nickel-dependent hydrogenase, large subunit [Candidatus Bathyarchaeota archaeon B23]|nr:MAG: Nickel-dependent hydrogenase, large subunit [Candidatus Bathyarchaeota archaeon B23]